jgi:transposase
MLKVAIQHWGQSREQLRECAFKAEHPRTRERLLALYEICEGKSASVVGKETGRNRQTVMEWVHKYNQGGIEALKYQHSGGHSPLYLNK